MMMIAALKTFPDQINSLSNFLCLKYFPVFIFPSFPLLV